MKKDFLFIIIQFIIIALYFIFIEGKSQLINNYIGYFLVAFFVVGLIILILGILSLNDNLTPLPKPKKNNSLISFGIYKYIRHPVYTGLIMSSFAYAFYSFSFLHIILSIFLTITFYFKSKLEEKYLLNFHEEYEEYMQKTGRFFPLLSRQKK